MAVSPTMLVAAVRATVRVIHAGDSALAEHVRNRDQIIPDANLDGLLYVSRAAEIADAYGHDAGLKNLVARDAALQAAWKAYEEHGFNEDLIPDQIELLDRTLKAYRASEKYPGMSPDAIAELNFGGRVRQWSEEGEPESLSTWERLAISLADTALEFVATSPNVLGIGGNGEKLIGAMAQNLSDLIPNDGKSFGPRQQFGERVLGIVLRAGLQTIANNPGLAFDDKHLRKLVVEVTTPVLEAFPEDGLDAQVNWQLVTDSILGPAVSAAFATVAENPKAFLGSKFSTEEAVGALTQSFLKTVARQGVSESVSREGLIALYTGALGVIAEHPEKFLGKSTNAKDKFFEDLLVKVSGLLKETGDKLDGELVLAVAVTGLESLKTNVPGLLGVSEGDSWEGVYQLSLQSVISGIQSGIEKKGNFEDLLSARQVTELARIFLDQVARTPGMVAGDGKELQSVVAGVARAMASDKDLLLSGDDWLEIAAVAAEEAAADPGRLFGFEDDTPAGHLAERAIGQILAATAADIRGSRKRGEVLFGDTLKRAIVFTLRGMASDAAAATVMLADQKLTKLVRELNELMQKADPDGEFTYGSRDWLALYRGLFEKLLADGRLVQILGGDGELTADGRLFVEKFLSGRE